jgi:hypothetical protein
VRGETYGLVDSDLDTPAARLWCGISVDRSWVGSVHRQNARTMEYGFIQAIEQAACKRPGKMDKHERLMNEMRSTSNTRETEATVSLYFSPKNTHKGNQPRRRRPKRGRNLCVKNCAHRPRGHPVAQLTGRDGADHGGPDPFPDGNPAYVGADVSNKAQKDIDG